MPILTNNAQDRDIEGMGMSINEGAVLTGAIGTPIVPRSVWKDLPAEQAAGEKAALMDRRDERRAYKVFLTNPAAMAGLAIFVTVIALALLAPVFFPRSPLSMVAVPFQWPGQNPAFPLGTDALGRDVAAGIFHGARVSLLVGLCATIIGMVIGIVMGAVAGFFGGYVDDIIVRITEVFQTMPNFLFLIVLVAIFQPSITTIIIGIGLTGWPDIARLTRAEFRSLRERDFVLAARASGFGNARIIFTEILPNALPPIIVTSSILLASSILNEGALSFLGMGDPNMVSWGTMIGEGRDHLRTAWYLVAVPGVALILTVLAANLLGEGLNDALNPRYSKDG